MGEPHSLALQASSLLPDPFPIEGASFDCNGRDGSLVIHQADRWIDQPIREPDWSSPSERVHGITINRLLDEGEPHGDVAPPPAEVVAIGHNVVALNAPEFDEAWLTRLLRAGHVTVRVKMVDVVTRFGVARRSLFPQVPVWEGKGRELAWERVRNVAREVVGYAEQTETIRPGVRHRAPADAESLRRTRTGVQAAVARYLSRESAR